MLTAAFVLLAAAVTLGAILAVLHLRAAGGGRGRARLAMLHGLVALAGLAGLLLALRGPPRGLATGEAAFGAIAAWLLAIAALLGIGIFAARRRMRGLVGTAIGIHATIAVSGFVVLGIYLLAG
jgi:hypothetical protein